MGALCLWPSRDPVRGPLLNCLIRPHFRSCRDCSEEALLFCVFTVNFFRVCIVYVQLCSVDEWSVLSSRRLRSRCEERPPLKEDQESLFKRLKLDWRQKYNTDTSTFLPILLTGEWMSQVGHEKKCFFSF